MIPVKKSELKVLMGKLHVVMSAPTTGELGGMIEKFRVENEVKRDKLRGFREGSTKQISREDAEGVEQESKYWGMRRRARKEAFLQLEALLLDGMTKEEIWERAGIEGDEE